MTDPPDSTSANLATLRALQVSIAPPRDDDRGSSTPPRAGRPRRVPQPVDRSQLHGPLVDLPRSREQAKAEGAPFYFLGLTCTRRHNAPRTTLRRACVACQQEDHQKARQASSRNRARERRKAAAKAEREAIRLAREAEREATKKAKAQEKAAASRAATKAAKAAAKAAALAQAAEASQGPATPFLAPPSAPPAQEVSTDLVAPWKDDDSAPWDLSPAPAPAAPPLPSSLPSSVPSTSPAGPCPWDDTDDINPFN